MKKIQLHFYDWKKSRKFKCNLCEKSFAYVQFMKKHMRSEHSGYSYELPESSFTEPKEDLEPKKSSTGYLALN